jgi:CO/xanthine dehydrogenase Mo-binding subunit
MLICAEHIPGVNSLADCDIPLLADKKLSYIGEPVAILAGPERGQLEAYAAECKVIVEEDTPVFDMDSADAEIFEHRTLEIDLNEKETARAEAKMKAEAEAAAIAAAEAAATAGTDSVAEAKPEPLIVSGVYKTSIQEHWYSEPHGALAGIDGDSITIYTASQCPDHVKKSAAAVLGLNEDLIAVAPVDLGVHLDGKIWYPSLMGSLAALATFVTKRNIKIMLSRKEDMLYSPKRAATEIAYSSVLDEQGQIIETNIKIYLGTGAHSVFIDPIMTELCSRAAGVYKLGRIKLEAFSVRTNLPPACAFSGYGAAQGAFALERHIARIVDTLRDESIDWRKKNIQYKAGAMQTTLNHAGVTQAALAKKKASLLIDPLFDLVTKKSDYKRKWASYELLRRLEKDEDTKISPLRGIGIAVDVFKTQTSGDNAAAVCVVEIEIDSIACEPLIRGVWIAINAAKPEETPAKTQNMDLMLRSLNGALGWTLTERIRYDDGKIVCGHNDVYMMPSPADLPTISIDFVETEETATPANIEEIPYCLFPPAFLQATSQATNHYFESIPISAWDIWQALNAEPEPARVLDDPRL